MLRENILYIHMYYESIYLVDPVRWHKTRHYWTEILIITELGLVALFASSFRIWNPAAHLILIRVLTSQAYTEPIISNVVHVPPTRSIKNSKLRTE